MRTRCPLKIINGQTYCWAREGSENGYPRFVLTLPNKVKKSQTILRFPRNTGVIMELELRREK